MAFYMKPGRGPMMKTGNGIPQTFQSQDALDVSDEQVEAPSALLQTDPTDPKDPKAKAEKKEHHPGYEKTEYGKSFEPVKGNDFATQVINLTNKRAFSKDSANAKARDLETKFPAIGKPMQSQGALSNYIARGVSADTGDYTVSKKGDFASNTSTVSRRDVAESSRQSMYVPKITKNKK